MLSVVLVSRTGLSGEIVYDGLPADLVPLAPKALLLGAGAAGKDLVAAGEYGVVIRSSDNEHWRQLPLPAQQLITDVHFVDENIGWVVGHDGLILKTIDGGEHWVFQHYTPEAEIPQVFMKILFSNEDKGYIIGSGGNLLETQNGGASWETRILLTDEEVDAHLYGMVRLSDGTLMLAGEMATIFRSKDDGATWQQLRVDYDGSFFSILSMDDDSVLVFGMKSNIYRTEDQGETWQKIDPGGSQASLVSGVQLKDGRVVLVGRSGTVLVSEDRGKTFINNSLEKRIGINVVAPWESGYVLFGDVGVMGVH